MKKTVVAVLLLLLLLCGAASGEVIFEVRDGVVVGYSGSGDAVLPTGAGEIAAWLMEGGNAVTSVTVPGNYAVIPAGFCVGSGITEAHIEDGVAALDNSAFKNCLSLCSAYVPSSVMQIGTEVFAGCSSLTVYTPSGSAMAQYCAANGIDCRTLSEPQPEIYEITPSAAVVGSAVSFRVTTSTAADSLVLMQGNSKLLTFTAYTDAENVRTWSGTFTFSTAGSHALTFVSGDVHKELTLTVTQPEAAVTDAAFDKGIESGTPTQLTVRTTASAAYLRLLGRDGKEINRWTTGYTADGDRRVWNVEAVLDDVGTYMVSLSASADGKSWSKSFVVSVTVSAFATAVKEVEFADTVLTDRETDLTVMTTADAEYVAMYTESGSLVKTWSSGYTDRNGLRVWTLKYTFSGAGERKLIFRASRDGKRYGGGISAVKTVQLLPNIENAAFSSDVMVGKAAQLIVRTTTSAGYLRMYAENGGAVKTWSSGYTDENGVRTWRLEYTFASAGDRKLSFRASADGKSYYSEMRVNVKVTNKLPSVSAAAVPSAADVGNTVTMTVKTGTDAKYLSMSAENGSIVKTWSSGYKDGNGVRLWTVSYAFSGVGSRSITFRASSDKRNWGNGVMASISVCPKVLQVSMPAVNTVGAAAVVTVKTSTSARYLNMYAENGAKAASWSSGYTDASGVRTWTVKYAFSGAGKRTLTFRASSDNKVFGGSASANTTVCPAVKSVSFASGGFVGESVAVTVTTDKTAKTVVMCAENGAAVKSWTSGYTDSGSVRTWKLNYTFSGAGARRLTFRASADGKSYGVGCTASVNIAPAVTGVSFDEGAAVGIATALTVKTSIGARYVRMYAENGGAVKTWTSGYADSGNTRVWTLWYTFAGGGRRTLSFRSSCDGSNWGSGMSASVSVKK